LGALPSCIIGGAIIVGGMIAFYLVWASDDPYLPALGRKLLASTFCVAGAAIGAFMIAAAARQRVILDADAIEVVGCF